MLPMKLGHIEFRGDKFDYYAEPGYSMRGVFTCEADVKWVLAAYNDDTKRVWMMTVNSTGQDSTFRVLKLEKFYDYFVPADRDAQRTLDKLQGNPQWA